MLKLLCLYLRCRSPLTPPNGELEASFASHVVLTVVCTSPREEENRRQAPVASARSNSGSVDYGKRKKEDCLRKDPLPTQSFIRLQLTKFSKKVRKEIEEAKSLINMHVDELERQVNQLRDEVKKWGVLPLIKDVKAFTTRMILLETEVKHRFEEMDANRRLDRLEKKLSVLPEIKETLNLLMTTSTQPAPQEGREQPEEDVIDFELGPYKEGLKTDESKKHHDDEKIQEELRLQNRLLTKNSHEMFVIQHRIEEAEKKLDHDPKVKHRVDELKIEKRRLREEEVELENKIEDLKRQLRHNWEKRQEKGRRGSSTRRERHHSTPGPSHRRGGV